MHKVTVIIPNYNGIQFLEPCLNSLQKQSFSDFSTILVDNGSTDSSISFVAKNFPLVKCISLKKNFGFAFAVNVGIRKSNSPYVLLLNTDTVLHPDFLFHMVRQMESSDRIFSVGSKMLQANAPTRIDTTGDFYTICGYAFCRGQGQIASLYTHTTEIFSACAGAALYRRSVFEQIGLFDSRFFAYLEDVDIGYRARLFGWTNVYCPEAIVYHVGGGTSGHGYTPFKVYHSARNNLFLLKKNMFPAQLVINTPFVCVGCILKYIYFRNKNLGSSYLKGLRDGIRMLSHFKQMPVSAKQKRTAWQIEWNLFCHTLSYTRQYVLTHPLHF